MSHSTVTPNAPEPRQGDTPAPNTRSRLRRTLVWAGVAAALALLAAVTTLASMQPRLDRAWEQTQSRMPSAELDGDSVTVRDIRDFRYLPDGTWEPRWYDATFDLSALQSADFVLTRFSDFEGVAHVMASFAFDDGRRLVLSYEIRRELGETYSPLKGMFRNYELMVVASDERDALALRTEIHRDPTWIFPVRARPETVRRFFVDMLERMNRLRVEPEWYSTLGNSCSTNLAAHYEAINAVDLPPDYRVALPGYADRLVASLGLLPDGMTLEQARERYRVQPVTERAGDPIPDDYSTRIRQTQPALPALAPLEGSE